MRGQLGLEALISFSAFLAFLLVLFYAFMNLHATAGRLSDELAARYCASGTAELDGYYGLDGLHSHFPLDIRDAVEIGGEVHCTRGNFTAVSKVLVTESEKEPI